MTEPTGSQGAIKSQIAALGVQIAQASSMGNLGKTKITTLTEIDKTIGKIYEEVILSRELSNNEKTEMLKILHASIANVSKLAPRGIKSLVSRLFPNQHQALAKLTVFANDLKTEIERRESPRLTSSDRGFVYGSHYAPAQEPLTKLTNELTSLVSERANLPDIKAKILEIQTQIKSMDASSVVYEREGDTLNQYEIIQASQDARDGKILVPARPSRENITEIHAAVTTALKGISDITLGEDDKKVLDELYELLTIAPL